MMKSFEIRLADRSWLIWADGEKSASGVADSFAESMGEKFQGNLRRWPDFDHFFPEINGWEIAENHVYDVRDLKIWKQVSFDQWKKREREIEERDRREIEKLNLDLEKFCHVEENWNGIVRQAEMVAKAYLCFVRKADDLASQMLYDRDFVLRNVLPRRLEDRRRGKRILQWVESIKGEVVSHLFDRIKAFEKLKERQELLEKLKLTEDQKKILGIRD